MNLTIEVRDSAYAEVNNANVVAVVHDPSGDSITVPLDWDVEQDGHYDGGFSDHCTGAVRGLCTRYARRRHRGDRGHLRGRGALH